MAASAAMYSNTTESQYIASSTVQFYARKIRSDLSDRIGGGSGSVVHAAFATGPNML
jgi:hypothetical protein